MINLTKRIGLPVKFNPKNTDKFEFTNPVYNEEWNKTLAQVWRSMRFAKDYTDQNGEVAQQPDLNQFLEQGNSTSSLYFGFRGTCPYNIRQLLLSQRIRPDITILPPGAIGTRGKKEFLRTEGHEHLSGLPEIYETVYGRNIFLLFKPESRDSDSIEDVIAVYAEQGDHTVFPPNYQHISINIGEGPLVLTDLVSTEANTNFDYIRKHNGAPYWVLRGRHEEEKFDRNPRYGTAPKIRLLWPVAEIPELGLKKREPMFNLIQNGNDTLAKFLNNPDGSQKIYSRVFQH